MLTDQCKHEILRVAELQSEDYHLDRPLFYACREDREIFCRKTPSGGGKVFKCLYRHKFEKSMSQEVGGYCFLLSLYFWIYISVSNTADSSTEAHAGRLQGASFCVCVDFSIFCGKTQVNKALSDACQQDIVDHQCLKDLQPGGSFKEAKMATILLCLETVIKDGACVSLLSQIHSYVAGRSRSAARVRS